MKRPKRFANRLVGLGLLACLCCGCGKPAGPYQRAAVEGTVTLGGQEIEQGSITFYPTGDTRGMVAGGPIQGGRYSISAGQGPVVGLNLVKINASRKTGRKVQDAFGDPGKLMDETEEAVPEQYNTKSTLVREVKFGKNVFDFQLNSQ